MILQGRVKFHLNILMLEPENIKFIGGTYFTSGENYFKDSKTFVGPIIKNGTFYFLSLELFIN